MNLGSSKNLAEKLQGDRATEGTKKAQVGPLLTCPSFKKGEGDSLVLVLKITGTFSFDRQGVQTRRRWRSAGS